MNMKNVYIKIKNEGEIDINAFKLLGATSKRGDDTKIGYFGSGLKYAMAVLIRNDIPFNIFSGEKEVKVTTTKRKFRGEEFDVIKINNQMTSLTTAMGIDWKEWFAIREVYCNAVDEGEYSLDVVDECIGEKGKTIFYIQFSDKIKEVFNNWNNYFSDKRTDIISKQEECKFFSGGKKLIVYRKGVNVFEMNKQCLFHYDLKNIQIGEDRTVKSEFDMRCKIIAQLREYASTEMIRSIYDNWQETYEGTLNWDYEYNPFNNNWLEVLGGRTIVLNNTAGYFAEEMSDNTIILPDKLGIELKSYFKDKIKVMGFSDKYGKRDIVDLNEKQEKMLEYGINFLQGECNIKDYEVKLCRFDDNYTLGEANNGAILISPRAFERGKKCVISTLIEEYSHLDSTAGDKTRKFQNYLINKFISIIEDKKNITL